MEKQMTAVQTMIKEIEDLITIETFQKWKDIKSKALEMEKQQLYHAWTSGWVQDTFINKSDDYYNETYGK